MNLKFTFTFLLLTVCGIYGDDGTTVPPTTTEKTTTPPTTTSSTTPPTTTPTTTPSTTPSTTSSTTVPTTPIPSVPGKYYYNVTENDVTCMMVDASLKFEVTYNIGQNNTNKTTIELPKPSSDVRVSGSCAVEHQSMEVHWGKSVSESSVTFIFAESKDKKHWSLQSVSSVIYIGSGSFVNASDEGKSIASKFNLDFNPVEVPVNHSLKCFTMMSSPSNVSTIEDTTYTFPVVISVSGIQIEAFNGIGKQKKFGDELHCDADKIADIVPIAVGCALAALVVVVLIAYIIGRRRRSMASYQSV